MYLLKYAITCSRNSSCIILPPLIIFFEFKLTSFSYIMFYTSFPLVLKRPVFKAFEALQITLFKKNSRLCHFILKYVCTDIIYIYNLIFFMLFVLVWNINRYLWHFYILQINVYQFFFVQ